jgi:hypothetical protein
MINPIITLLIIFILLNEGSLTIFVNINVNKVNNSDIFP